MHKINHQNYYITIESNSKKIAIINCSLEIIKIKFDDKIYDLVPSQILIPYNIKKIEREKFLNISFIKFEYLPTNEGKQIINSIIKDFKNYNRIIIIVPEKCAIAYKDLNLTYNIRICNYSDINDFEIF